MTLILPDTDTALKASESVGTELQQTVAWPTPWAAEAGRQLKVGYQQTQHGWSARVLSDLIGADGAQATSATDALNLDAPVVLKPVFIPKPWGQEIWFSGIEARGETTVAQGDVQLPLSAYLALAPQRLVRRAQPLLLKILDPNASATRGNLYFETHNTKHEVYVVTRVADEAWPDGVGAIRIGMDQALRSAAASDSAFRADYLAAVTAYEKARRALDDNPQQHNDAALLEQEAQLRARMEAFTAKVPLRVGDVVQVAPHIPHSLQHGVQAFEFQTPTYERNIISFNQQVLTQDHWDSAYAIEQMSLAGPPAPDIELLSETADLRVETIVDFTDFDVLRVTLSSSGAAVESALFAAYANYSMVAVISGEIDLATAAGSVQLAAASDEQHAQVAALVPAAANAHKAVALSEHATLLLARPKSSMAGTIPISE